MKRCLQLAALGAGRVAPNPMVGALLVHDGIIIGEGYHQQYGQAHAEVNCISSVHESNKDKINQSILYVSLEPCSHFGKTPPCAQFIIENKIPEVVIGCRDPNKVVNGKGIALLKDAGIKVTEDVLEKECKDLNKRFFTFHTLQRPFIILKWAESRDGKMAGAGGGRILISNDLTNRLVHRWRSEEAAILVGTNTAITDDPILNARLWPGNDPVRMVIDRELILPTSLHLFDHSAPTLVFNTKREESDEKLSYIKITEAVDFLQSMMHLLYKKNIQSVLVEGGAKLLQSFIDAGLWDEARVIINEKLMIGKGINAPILVNSSLVGRQTIAADKISIYQLTQ